MKIRLPILATALASTVALAPGLSQASTLYEEYFEYVSYQFTYYFPSFPVAIDTGYLEYDTTASIRPDTGGYNCFDEILNDNAECGNPYPIWFSLALVGSSGQIVPLDNMTLDLTALPTTLGGYDVIGQEFFVPGSCPESYGSITFGPSGEIASYSMGFSDYCGNAEAYSASSTPSLLSGLDDIIDGHLVEGLSVYDSMYWEPDENFYSLRPGYWHTSITRECRYYVYEEGYPYPIDSNDICRENNGETPEPTAPIPLPAAGWLLLGALGTLGLARRRRG